MIICGHEIDERYIIGIGPIMIRQSGDITVRQLYNSRQLSFMLHLKNHSITIESGWLELGMDNCNTGQVDLYQKFKEEHTAVAKVIREMILNCKQESHA